MNGFKFPRDRKRMRDGMPKVRYEARILDSIKDIEGGYAVLMDEMGEPIEGDDFWAVKAGALAEVGDQRPRLVIAKITVEYIKPL
jgi:hypothetical protein